MKEQKKIPQTPKELARIALDMLQEDSFISCYWHEFVKNGTSIEEFIAHKSNIDDIIKDPKKQITQNEKDVNQWDTGKKEDLWRAVDSEDIWTTKGCDETECEKCEECEVDDDGSESAPEQPEFEPEVATGDVVMAEFDLI